jgi:hypothetical protein
LGAEGAPHADQCVQLKDLLEALQRPHRDEPLRIAGGQDRGLGIDIQCCRPAPHGQAPHERRIGSRAPDQDPAFLAGEFLTGGHHQLPVRRHEANGRQPADQVSGQGQQWTDHYAAGRLSGFRIPSIDRIGIAANVPALSVERPCLRCRRASGNSWGKSLKGKSMRSMNKAIVLSGLAAFAIAMLGVTIWISEPAKSKEDKGDNGQTITRLGF